MKHRNSHLLVGYWSRLRYGRDVPDQADVNPRAVKRMLTQMFILDASDPTRASFRLAGTWLCERFGLELKGTSFLDTWDVQSGKAVVSLLRQSLAAKQPVCISSIGSTADCAMVEVETVLAPLSFGPGGPTRFLGILHFLGNCGAHPGQPITFQRLVGSKLIRENEPLSGPPPDPPPDPPLGTFRHPERQHLRLVVSRDRAVTVHFEMDKRMRELFSALEIQPIAPLSLL